MLVNLIIAQVWLETTMKTKTKLAQLIWWQQLKLQAKSLRRNASHTVEKQGQSTELGSLGEPVLKAWSLDLEKIF